MKPETVATKLIHDWTGPTQRIRHVHCQKCGQIFEINKPKGECKMRFDEEPDGDIHGECAAEIRKLRDLLRDEFNRGHRLDSPWDCFEHDCPCFGQPMQKSCCCYQDATKAHIAAVLKEINQS